MLVMLVPFSSEASASCDDCCHGRRSDACCACAAPRGGGAWAESAAMLLPWCRRSGTRRAGALLVGNIGWVAIISADQVAVMVVVLVLLLGEKGIGGIGDEAAAVVGAAVLVVLGDLSRWRHRLGNDGCY